MNTVIRFLFWQNVFNINYWIRLLVEFVCKGDFIKFKIIVDAHLKNWNKIRFFLNSYIDKLNFNMDEKNIFLLACEEVFDNICHYAYKNLSGKIEFKLEFKDKIAKIEISDTGVKFDPTHFKYLEDDIRKPSSKRRIGGMGIYIINQIMDKIEYQRKHNQNYLFLFKILVK
ncbi:MAG: ATP-binding protein [Oscillospiraceae bacterium]|nr:ATP-binding protein [Oscillospiraceae bacterium]